MQCNHSETKSHYCPVCGKLLKPSAGVTLLAHAERTLSKLQTEMGVYKARWEGDSGANKYNKRNQVAVDKWDEWVGWIRRQLGKGDE